MDTNILNGRTFFLGGLYHTIGMFSSLRRFISRFGERLDPLDFNGEEVLKESIKLIHEYRSAEGRINSESALKLLMANDIENARHLLADYEISSRIVAEAHYENTLVNCRDQGIALIYQEFGLSINPPEIFIVEKFPPPYDRAGYHAFAADEGDQQKHGIEPGIYFLREGLRPFYSRFMLLHELIHTIFGEKDPQLLGRGLEEGLSEILGSIYLSSKILGRGLTRNLFIYNRLSFGQSQFWELYLDYTRIAASILYQFGLHGLIALIEGGRKRIKDIESKCLRGESLDLPRGGWNSDLIDLVNYLLLGYGRNLVVSPLAKYMMPYVKPSMTSMEIIRECNADIEEGHQALKELQERVLIAVFRNDWTTVSSSDCFYLTEGPIVRYDI